MIPLVAAPTSLEASAAAGSSGNPPTPEEGGFPGVLLAVTTPDAELWPAVLAPSSEAAAVPAGAESAEGATAGESEGAMPTLDAAALLAGVMALALPASLHPSVTASGGGPRAGNDAAPDPAAWSAGTSDGEPQTLCGTGSQERTGDMAVPMAGEAVRSAGLALETPSDGDAGTGERDSLPGAASPPLPRVSSAGPAIGTGEEEENALGAPASGPTRVMATESVGTSAAARRPDGAAALGERVGRGNATRPLALGNALEEPGSTPRGSGLPAIEPMAVDQRGAFSPDTAPAARPDPWEGRVGTPERVTDQQVAGAARRGLDRRSAQAPEPRGAEAVPRPGTAGRIPEMPTPLDPSPAAAGEAPPREGKAAESGESRAGDPPRGIERAETAPAMREASRPDPAGRPASVREALTPQGVDRVVGAVRTSLAHGGMEVRLRLHPESLGEVRVQVRWEGGMVSARLEATTPAARETLEGGAQALRAALQDQGIPVERLSVGIRMDLQARSQGQELAERRHDFASRSESAAGDAPARAPEPMTPDVRGRGRLDLRI